MSEARNENRLRPFWGEIGENPFPLEVSFNDCDRQCAYCFAILNGREVRSATAAGTVRFIARAFSDEHDPANFGESLLRARHGVVLSNAVDPLAARNVQPTMDVLGALRRVRVPTLLQTRGFHEKQKDRFREILRLLAPGSVVAMSVTTFDPTMLAKVERGCPPAEVRLEQLAMAHEAGFRTVFNINPAMPSQVGDPHAFVKRAVDLVGREAMDGVWTEALHISRRQMKSYLQRHPGGLLPVVDEEFQQAARGEYDGDFFEDLAAALDAYDFPRFTHGASDIMGTRADLFDSWSNPFPTYHPVIAECDRLYRESRKPVLVAWPAWKAWVGLRADRPYILKRGEFWSLVNQKQNVDQVERSVLPELLTYEQALRFLWNHPELDKDNSGFKAIGRNHWLKVVVDEQTPGDPTTARYVPDEEGDLLHAYAPEWGGTGTACVVDAEELQDFVLLPMGGPRRD